MEGNREKLKIASYLIIVLAIVNVIIFSVKMANGQLNKEIETQLEQTMNNENTSEEDSEQAKDIVTKMMTYSSIGGIVISTLIYIYLTVKGLHQSEGKVKGKANRIWALIFVASALMTVMTVIPAFRMESQSQPTIISIIQSLATLIIMLFYRMYVKKVVDEE